MTFTNNLTCFNQRMNHEKVPGNFIIQINLYTLSDQARDVRMVLNIGQHIKWRNTAVLGRYFIRHNDKNNNIRNYNEYYYPQTEHIYLCSNGVIDHSHKRNQSILRGKKTDTASILFVHRSNILYPLHDSMLPGWKCLSYQTC
jgi:hypothetical protein